MIKPTRSGIGSKYYWRIIIYIYRICNTYLIKNGFQFDSFYVGKIPFGFMVEFDREGYGEVFAFP